MTHQFYIFKFGRLVCIGNLSDLTECHPNPQLKNAIDLNPSFITIYVIKERRDAEIILIEVTADFYCVKKIYIYY